MPIIDSHCHAETENYNKQLAMRRALEVEKCCGVF